MEAILLPKKLSRYVKRRKISKHTKRKKRVFGKMSVRAQFSEKTMSSCSHRSKLFLCAIYLTGLIMLCAI